MVKAGFLLVLCSLRLVRCPCLTRGLQPDTLASVEPTSPLPPWYNTTTFQLQQLLPTLSQKSRTCVCVGLSHSGSHGSSQRLSSSGSRFVRAAGRSDWPFPSVCSGRRRVLVPSIALPPGGTQRAPVGAPGANQPGEDGRRSQQPSSGQSGESAVQQRDGHQDRNAGGRLRLSPW